MVQTLDENSTFRRRLRLRSHRQLRHLTLWPLGVVVGLTLVLVAMIAFLFKSAEWVDHSNNVLSSISRVEKLAVDAETGVRGYRITSDATLLEPYEQATAVMPAQLDALQSLVRDNPAQLAQLALLRQSLRDWSENATTVRERTASGQPLSVPLHLTGKALMDVVREHINAMQTGEQALLGERSSLRARVRLFILPGILLTGLVFAPLLVASIRRSLAHLDTSYRAAWDESDRDHARLDVILSSIGDAVIATDIQGSVSYLNPVAVALTGWPLEEARGKSIDTIFRIINEQDRSSVESPVTQVLRAGIAVTLPDHTLLIARDGREIPIADSAAPIRDIDGTITGAVLVFRDQTDEREAQRRLRESETRKAAILNSSLDAILSMDAGGLIVEFNPAAEAIFGHRASEVIGRPLADVIIPERLRAAHNRGLAHYLATGSGPVLNRRLELPALRADGTEFSAELSLHRIEGIEPPFFSGFIRDITERKRAEEALRVSEERHRAMFAGSPMAVFVCDSQAVIQHYNQRAVELWGREPARGVEKHCGSVKLWLPNGSLLPHEQSPMMDVLRTGVPTHNVEVFIERPDGSRLPVLVNFAALKEADGTISGAITSFTDITERKKAEDDLAEKTRLLDLTTDAILIRGLDGLIMYWNNGAEKLYGWTREEAIGKTSHELLQTEFIKPFEEITEELLRTGHWTGEFIHTKRNGERITVLARKVLDRDREGRPAAVLQTLTDITERKRIEQQLRESNEALKLGLQRQQQLIEAAHQSNAQLQVEIAARKQSEEALARIAAIVEHSNDAIIGKDLNGIITSWNAGAEQIFGYTAQEAVGQPVTLLITPDHADEEHSILERIRRGEKIDHYETIRRRKDGSLVDLSLTISPIFDTQGQIVGASKVARDITGRKRAQESLGRLAALVESSDDALFGQNLEGIITSWNRGAEDIFGYRTDEIVGTSIMRLIPEAWQPEEIDLQRKMAAGERVGNFETVRQARDGRQFPVSITVSPLRNEDGNVIGASKVVRDITKRKQAESDLLDSNQRIGLAAEATGVGFWQWNVLTNEIRWDAQLFQIYGIPPTDNGMVHYNDWSSALVPEDLPENEAILHETVRTCGQSTRHFRIRRRSDGACRHIEAVETTRTNAQGATEWVLGTNQDITERIEAVEALRAAGERFRFMAESMPQKIFTAQPDGQFDYFNQQWLEYTGLTVEQIKASGWNEFIHTDDLEENTRHWQHCIDTGDYFELEHRFRRTDGVYRWHLSRAHAMRDTGGKITMWIGSNTDIDDMMRAQEELIDAESQLADRAVQLEVLVAERTEKLSAAHAQLLTEADERKRLEAEVAVAVEGERERLGQELHDGLVQELVGVGMMLHVLERQMKTPVPEFANEAARLGNMIELAQEHARNLAKNFYPVELEQHGLLVALEGIAQRTRQQSGIHCAVQADEHIPARVHGNSAVQLFRIAQEAVQNATKHAQAKNIHIRLGRQDGSWLLTVKDDGVGLPDDAHQASGMGLRILQYRARIIQGTLSVTNNADGGVLVSCSAPASQFEA